MQLQDSINMPKLYGYKAALEFNFLRSSTPFPVAKFEVFIDVTPCRWISVSRRFEGT
jgi:hypothetical protein